MGFPRVPNKKEFDALVAEVAALKDNTPPPQPTPSVPGAPPTGSAYWGCSFDFNGDVVPRHETLTGTTLGVHRTFGRDWSKRPAMVKFARDDHANNRLPYISIKPGTWTDYPLGRRDADLDAFLTDLDSLGEPVWLSMHHEPEGGGGVNQPDQPSGPAGHLAMNRHVRTRMNLLGTTNIALVGTFMAYTWDPASGRNPDEWFEPGVYDILGIDHYAKRVGVPLVNDNWERVKVWAALNRLPIALGEFGTKTNGTDGEEFLHDFWEDCLTSGVYACAYYDSPGGTDGPWTLTNELLSEFHRILTEDPRVARL